MDSSNTPKVVTLAPPITVQAGPFEPVPGDQGALAHLRTWTTDDGLPMDDIMCGYLDAHGMLWFGTNGGGITRYDGRSFTNYTMAHGLPDNVILAIGGDSKGNIWIGTSTGGLCKYDGRTFTTLAINDATGLARGITCMLEDPDGTLWFGSRGRGLHRYDGQHFTTLTKKDGLVGDFIRGMARSTDGALWLSTMSGISRYDGKRFMNYTEANRNTLSDVDCIVRGKDDQLWLGHTGGGLTRCVTGEREPHFTDYPVIAGEQVRVDHLWADAQGTLWIATAAHGVIRFEPRHTEVPTVTRYTTDQGLASDEVLCITADRHGDLWFGTRGAGLVHYRGKAFTNFRSVKPISIAEDPAGGVWVGTTNGLAHCDGTRMTEQRVGHRPGRWNYSVSTDPQGRVGFGSNLADLELHGISWYDGTNYRVIAAENERGWAEVFWTMHDRRGKLWAGGRRGVDRYDVDSRTTYTSKQGLGASTVLCVHEDRDGAIWVGTDGGGISRIDSTSVTTWTTTEGLPNNAVWCIDEDPGGALWIATLSGLCRYDGKGFLTFTTQDGLPDENINQVFVSEQDRSGVLIGTIKGIAILTGWKDAGGKEIAFNGELLGASNSAIENYMPVFEVYNTTTGFPVKDVQTAEHVLLEDSKGVIWISTGSDKTGLVRFDRKALRADPAPLNVELLDVTINNERVCWYDLSDATNDSATVARQEAAVFGRVLETAERTAARGRLHGVSYSGIGSAFAIPKDLVLSYQNNRIGFEFVGVETSRPEGVEYRCMLEGYDADWSPVTRMNTASFGNISEGEYTFKVKAKSPSGVWSEPLAYHFTVLPPWWRTWWAYALGVLALGGGVLLYIRLRVAGLKHQRSKLERTVAERTVELRHKKEEADQQRSRAELSEKAKEQFLANMSHEIRTPMNAIMGMSEILRNREHSPEQAKYLNAIGQSSENLLVIINDILDLTKIDAGRVEFESVPFDVRNVIGNVQDIMRFKAEQKGIGVDVAIADDVPAQLIGDPTRLNQIVMNLAGNAVKFTEHGSVTIRAWRSIDALGRPAWISLVIDVIDTGIGIPEDRIEKIFDEFTQAYSDTTRKYGGTGLGLTISKRLTELQGGRISVKSEREKGSTFTVAIPYTVNEQRSA